MKVGIYSESSADEAALRILVDALVGRPTQRLGLPRLRARGWPSVLDYLRTVIQHLYYQTDGDGLIVVVDSDKSPLHNHPSGQAAEASGKCRLCLLQGVVRSVQGELASVAGRSSFKVAIGLASPSIEAWYRCGLDPHVSEVTWSRALQDNEYPYDVARLKRVLYGTDRPSLELATRVATEQARRLADTAELARLEKLFPSGFGTLAHAVRGWLPDGS